MWERLIQDFLRLARIHIFASLCLGKCGTSIARGIKAMMTCLCPFFRKNTLSYIKKIK
jgi:hypothetical protein